jgi:hypothetical protein
MDPKVRAAIAGIGEQAWTPIRYPRAIWDDQLRCWVSGAQVAEVEYTAFTSKKGQAITARLIVRRVKDLNHKAAVGQGELFTAWRYHAVFTDSPFTLVQAGEPTGATARSLTCPPAHSPPAPPGWRSPPSAATCCAPPDAWPASPAPKPAAPPCAAT